MCREHLMFPVLATWLFSRSAGFCSSHSKHKYKWSLKVLAGDEKYMTNCKSNQLSVKLMLRNTAQYYII